jgi:type II restriction/modification system DNA methylase subunit YeeA
LQHGYPFKVNPILDPLDQIECRDALMNADGSEAVWPRVSVVIGNPPFVGNKKMRSELGDAYFEQLTRIYSGAISAGVDFVCYWFLKALSAIKSNGLGAAGLVATNSIRGGVNQAVLQAIVRDSRIFDAWSDEAWVNDGASVRVSLVSFGNSNSCRLNGGLVTRIGAALAAIGDNGELDFSMAEKLASNKRACFMGITKVGSFDIDGQIARDWLRMPNPNGRSSGEVLRPSFNGIDVTRRQRDGWIVDFGVSMLEQEAAAFERPYEHLHVTVRPERSTNNRDAYREVWWRHGEARPGLRALLAPLGRFIVTPEVAKHRMFVFVHSSVLPDKNLQVVREKTSARLAYCTLECMSCGLCGWVRLWRIAHATHRPVVLKPTRSPPASPLPTQPINAPKRCPMAR